MNYKLFLKKHFPGFAYYLLRTKKPYLIDRNRIFKHLGIDLVLDVGANIGLYAHQIRHLGYSGKIFSFEPLKDEFNELQKLSLKDDDWEVYNFAVGETDTLMTLNITNNSVSSSFLELDEKTNEILPNLEYINKQNVEMLSMSSLFDKYCKNFRNIYLKLDTQGYEMKILQSSGDMLKKIKAIQFETQLIQMYKGSGDFSSIVNLLEAQGFVPAYFEPGWSNPKTGLMVELDVIFINKNH